MYLKDWSSGNLVVASVCLLYYVLKVLNVEYFSNNNKILNPRFGGILSCSIFTTKLKKGLKCVELTHSLCAECDKVLSWFIVFTYVCYYSNVIIQKMEMMSL